MNNFAKAIHPGFRWAGLGIDRQQLRDPKFIRELTLRSGQPEAVDFLLEWCDDSSHIHAWSSGTTGTPKRIHLDKQAMAASAFNTIGFFDLGPDSRVLLALPAQYIGGKMLILRALIGGMKLEFAPLSTRLDLPTDRQWDLTPLTPHLALSNLEELHRLGTLLLGGAPVGDNLTHWIQSRGLTAFESYGSTETMSHVALRRIGPKGENAFQALGDTIFSQNEEGCLVIHAPGLGLPELVTRDRVELHGPDRFVWKGRSDFVINSGGIKLHPERIEKKIAVLTQQRLLIVPAPHPELGQEAVLVVEGSCQRDHLLQNIRELPGLHKHEIPKRVLLMDFFPITPGGKVDRRKVIQLVSEKRDSDL